MERTIVSKLRNFLHKNDDLVRLFKTAIDMMPTDTHKIVISADKSILANMCVDRMLQLSKNWQLLLSVISFYLEILFSISETLSW